MNKIYWFTTSYRKKEAKFQNNLLNEGKVTFPRVDCCRTRSSVRRGTAHGPWRRLEAFSQSDVPSTALMLVVAFKLQLPPTNGVCLNVGTEMLICLLVDFDPITAEMAPGAIWHPYHVLSALCNVICLGRWLETRNSAESVDSPWSACS